MRLLDQAENCYLADETLPKVRDKWLDFFLSNGYIAPAEM